MDGMIYITSTEDCRFENRIEDDIRTFFGGDVTGFQENGLLIDRRVELYEHQAATLQDIERKRSEGIRTFLIVFPTASGKSRIVEEDMRNFASEKADFKALILAPNTDIVRDWHHRIEKSLREFQDKIEVNTFAYMVRNYTKLSPEEYSYIVIDEAHHAVAPILKRVIQYFTPEFMVGLTATDQRPDKLSKVLYLQQIGRGLRRTNTKKNVFVIDVVDEYWAMARPCSMHSIFRMPCMYPLEI